MDNPRIIIIKQKIGFAIAQNKKLSFDYVSKGLAITRKRIITPTSFSETKLYAKDDEKGFRQFDLDGIQELKILENKK